MAVRYVCDGCGDEFNGGVEIFSVPFPKESSDPIPFLASKHLCMPCHAFVFELGRLGVIGEARKKPDGDPAVRRSPFMHWNNSAGEPQSPPADHPMQGIVDAAKRVVDKRCQCSASLRSARHNAGRLYCLNCGGRRS